MPISDLTPGEPQDLWLDLGKPESCAVRNPLDVGVQARPKLPEGAARVTKKARTTSGMLCCARWWDLSVGMHGAR